MSFLGGDVRTDVTRYYYSLPIETLRTQGSMTEMEMKKFTGRSTWRTHLKKMVGRVTSKTIYWAAAKMLKKKEGIFRNLKGKEMHSSMD